YVKTMREELPRQFPGASFAFLPADIASQILNFGAPAPVDLQIVGNNVQTNRAYANALLARIKTIPGIADARIQQAFQQPTLNVNVDRSLAGLVGLSEKDAATAMQTTLAGSSQTSPTYWLNPKTGVSYAVSIQTPQRDLGTMSGLKNIPVTSSAGTGTQLLGGLATIQRTPSNAVVSHYNVQSILDPLVIVMALPTALAGIVWMLFATGTTLSVPALTGAIMCMGVATANSILVISFARERLAAGADAATAAI